MTTIPKPAVYRRLIDALVDDCHSGQGQIGPRRARAGVWNPHITAETAPDQHKMNLLLARLSPEERETIATMLAQEFEGGVFESLKALEMFEVHPFVDGYEGSPYNDFIGRLQGDWEWPDE
jgi:hypothetical protein